MQHEVELFSLREFAKALTTRSLEIPLPGYSVMTATGRAAMLSILTHMRNTGKLESKNSQFLIPHWLCNSLAQSMRKHCSPTLDPSQPIRAALVYHQYGFPQNMNEIIDHCDRKNIVLIEDCANILEANYQGKRLGTFGYASIFSFSKIFPSIWGAALTTSDKELYNHALKTQKNEHSVFVSVLLHVMRYLGDYNRNSKIINLFAEMTYQSAERAQKMNFLSKKIILNQIQENRLDQRKKNYHYIFKRFENRPYFQNLEKDVCPYVAPLFSTEDRMKKIVTSLQANGYSSGIYHFDENRNVFNPRFVRCAWVPIHQGISDEEMVRIADLMEIADA